MDSEAARPGENEVVSVHSSSASEMDDCSSTGSSDSDDDSTLGSSTSVSSPESSPVSKTNVVVPRTLKENINIEPRNGVFTLTKAPSNFAVTQNNTKQLPAEPLLASENNMKKNEKVERTDAAKKPQAARKRKTKAHDKNERSELQQLHEAALHPPRRVRRTPLEGVEAEQRRVQQEIAAARQRLVAQRTGDNVKKESAPCSKIASTEDDKPVQMENAAARITEAVAKPQALQTLANVATAAVAARPHASTQETTLVTVPPQTKVHAACNVPDKPHPSRPQAVEDESTTQKGPTQAIAAAAPIAAAKPAPIATSAKGVPNYTSNPATTPSGTKTKSVATSASSSSSKPRKKKQTFDEQVLSHMLLAFKPFTLKTLAQELKTTDTIVNFSMLTMIDKGLVIKKDFVSANGSNTKTLYWANHGVTAKELSTVPKKATIDEMQVTKHELNQFNSQNAALHRELAAVSETASNDDLKQQVLAQESQLKDIINQLDGIKDRIRSQQQPPAVPLRILGRVVPKSAAQIAREQCPRRTKIRINSMRSEWKIRKDKCINFIDTLADCLEKCPKEVVKLLDLETDEMVGVCMPPKHVV
ncbi:hypothetical protein MPSEU_000792400 [Mayamaea pseudoterrestris]|nr:hypothetical protein MPSEU_000792400 [Mayamaea pseudoterrestris]